MIDVTAPILRPNHLPADRSETTATINNSLMRAGVPEHLWPGLVRYFIMGIKPGDFLLAVLKNDLKDAVVRAGDPSILGPLIMWLNNCVPAPSWGDPAAVEGWMARKTNEQRIRG